MDPLSSELSGKVSCTNLRGLPLSSVGGRGAPLAFFFSGSDWGPEGLGKQGQHGDGSMTLLNVGLNADLVEVAATPLPIKRGGRSAELMIKRPMIRTVGNFVIKQ